MKTKTNLLFDLETTGLLRRGSTIHCIVMREMNTADEPIVFDYKPERAVVQGIKQLENADVLSDTTSLAMTSLLSKSSSLTLISKAMLLILLLCLACTIQTLVNAIMNVVLMVCPSVCTDVIHSKLGAIA